MPGSALLAVLLAATACHHAAPPPVFIPQARAEAPQVPVTDDKRDCGVLRSQYRAVEEYAPGYSRDAEGRGLLVDPERGRAFVKAVETSSAAKEPLSAGFATLAHDANRAVAAHAVEVRALLEALERRDTPAYQAASVRAGASEETLRSVDARLYGACREHLLLLAGGRLAPGLIQQVVRGHYSRFRACYEAGLARNVKLEGRVVVRFVISDDGTVPVATLVRADDATSPASDTEAFYRSLGIQSVPRGPTTSLPDEAVLGCIVNEYQMLRFPSPEGGVVTVVYPIAFSPG